MLYFSVNPLYFFPFAPQPKVELKKGLKSCVGIVQIKFFFSIDSATNNTNIS